MTRSLFAAADVYHDDVFRSAAMNMAIDEALFESAKAPSIRFYRWDHPALSFGYFGRFADVAEYKCDLVRRWTGGGIVFHGDDLTYSIVIPSSDPAFSESSMAIYERIHQALQTALGPQAELANVTSLDHGRGLWGAHAPSRAGDRALEVANFPEDFGERAEIRTPGACAPQMCFANPVRADVMISGRKIAGAAQRRTQRGLLQQGSIQLATGRVRVAAATGYVDLESGLAGRFARALSSNCNEREIDGEILNRAAELTEQKYGTDAWLRKR